jgi:hypothetical protein
VGIEVDWILESVICVDVLKIKQYIITLTISQPSRSTQPLFPILVKTACYAGGYYEATPLLWRAVGQRTRCDRLDRQKQRKRNTNGLFAGGWLCEYGGGNGY